MNRLEKILISVNTLIYIALAIFSYAYVDLNLTLTQNETFLNVVAKLQNFGYFSRPVSTLFYLFLIFLLFCLFIYSLYLFNKKKIGLRYLQASTIVNTLVLVFAYPFLSSDLFNYMFDAKIILNYHANPYTNRPLDFPNDEWLRFMRWVHRYSPYGPLWLGVSVIPAFLGFGKFLLSLLTFKLFISVFHLINTYLIYKILKKINVEMANISTAFYALNPIMLVEGVANAHNDVVLATFLIAPVYFLIKNKKAYSFLSLSTGVLIKYISIINLPWLIWYVVSKNRDVKTFIIMNLITMVLFTYLFSSIKLSVPFVSIGSTQVQFQPWYLFWTIPFVAVLGNYKLLVVFITISIGASLRYLPYLFYGDWSQQGTIVFMQIITFVPPIVALLFIAARKSLFKTK